MANDLERSPYVLQHLGRVFAKCSELAAAIRAGVMARQMGVDLPRKMLRQWSAEGLRGNRPAGPSACRTLFGCTRCLQVFKLELQLLYLPDHLLALGPEEQPLQLLHQKLQPLDLTCTRTQGRGIRLMLSDQQCLRGFQIELFEIRERGCDHARSMPREQCNRSEKSRMNTERNTYTLMTGSAVRRGARQSMPSSSIDS